MPSTIAELMRLAKSEPIARFLGMELEELSPGYARVAITLKPEHQNFNGTVFGGIIMSLADQATAYAANSISHPSVASQFNTHFLIAPKAGARLIAEGRVLKQGKRAGVIETIVVDEAGSLVAKTTATTIPLRGGPASRGPVTGQSL